MCIRDRDTTVNAVVGKIKRSKHNYAVAVKRKLDFVCKLVYLLDLFGDIASEKHRCLPVRQARAMHGSAIGVMFRPCFFKYAVNQLNVCLLYTSLIKTDNSPVFPLHQERSSLQAASLHKSKKVSDCSKYFVSCVYA